MFTAIPAKTLKIGAKMNVNRRPAMSTNPVLNILTKMVSKNTTQEQQISSDRSFVVRCLAVSVVFIVFIFGYSVVKEAQPLFQEAPTDKAIFAVLTTVLGIVLQMLSNYLNNSKPTVPPLNPCVPTPTPTVNLNPPTVNLSQPTVNLKPVVAPIATPVSASPKSTRIADDD